MSKSFNENSRVKIPALLHLTRLQYKYISLQHVDQQIDSETNIYKESFRVALNQINRIELTDKDVGSIISDLKNLLDAEDLAFVKDKLFQFDTDNAEKFRIQIQAVEDKKIILELQQAFEIYKECYNLAEQYGYETLSNQFKIDKISSLSKVVNQRVQMLNLKEAINNTDDMTTLINLAIDDLEFNFKKISEHEMGIKDDFLYLRREICQEFELNSDKKDPEYIALLEELRRILEQQKIEEMTAFQMQAQQKELKTLQKKIRDRNAENDRLTSKYFGDKKFMRIHKRLSSQFFSQTVLYELLIEAKRTIDDKLFDNYFVLENVAYFEGIVRQDLKLTSEDFPAPKIRTIASLITQEYINERNVIS